MGNRIMRIRRMKKETYEKLLRFGDMGSFMVWARPDDNKPTSNISDMSLFNRHNLLSHLTEGVVFVALNLSKKVVREDGHTGPWWNFHSEVSTNTDYRIRHAVYGTPYQGCYITDLIKNYPESKSNEVKGRIKSDPNIVEDNIKILKEELACFDVKPVIAAFGDIVYTELKKHLSDEYTIVKLRHYSANRGEFADKEVYREHVIDVLKNINWEEHK